MVHYACRLTCKCNIKAKLNQNCVCRAPPEISFCVLDSLQIVPMNMACLRHISVVCLLTNSHQVTTALQYWKYFFGKFGHEGIKLVHLRMIQ